MENKIYENSVLDEQTENIKEQETEFFKKTLLEM